MTTVSQKLRRRVPAIARMAFMEVIVPNVARIPTATVAGTPDGQKDGVKIHDTHLCMRGALKCVDFARPDLVLLHNANLPVLKLCSP